MLRLCGGGCIGSKLHEGEPGQGRPPVAQEQVELAAADSETVATAMRSDDEIRIDAAVINAATEAAEALTQDPVDDDGWAWKECDGAELEPLLLDDAELGGSPVALLDARFIIALAKSGGRLHSRQNLPPEAFISLAALRRMLGGFGIAGSLRILCLSYPWLQPE